MTVAEVVKRLPLYLVVSFEVLTNQCISLLHLKKDGQDLDSFECYDLLWLLTLQARHLFLHLSPCLSFPNMIGSDLLQPERFKGSQIP